MSLTPSPKQQFFGNNGRPLDGGLLYTYAAGTNTKIATYQNEAGTPNTNPIVLDFRGEANIWLDAELKYKYVLSPRDDTDPPTNPIWSVDNIAAGITIAELTQQFLGKIIWPRTQAEIDAGVTPLNYAYPEGYLYRYYGGSGDIGTALEDAISVKAQYGGGNVTLPEGSFTFAVGITLNAGVSLIGQGELSTSLTYSGSGIAISMADNFPSGNYSTLQDFKLTTTTSSPSLGPGTHGVRITDGTFIDLVRVGIRGFSTAGVHFLSSAGKASIYIDFVSCHIYENAIGLLVGGINSATNSICLTDTRIRASTNWNIYTDLDGLAWSISGGSYEAGGTSGTGGAIHYNGGQGLSITGAYFEQSGGASGLSCIDFSSLRPAYGISINGCFFQGGGTGTAITLGTFAFVNGINICGNFFSSWSVGINPAAVIDGIIAGNGYTSVTTRISAPGASCTGLIIDDTVSLKTYAAPISALQWDGSAWSGFPAYRYTTVPIGATAYGTLGNDTQTVNGTIYYAEIHITDPMILTGVGIISGSIGGGADKYIVSLYSATGALLANSTLAGTTFGGTDTLQQAAFTTAYAASPGKYWIGVQANGTTGRIRTVAANTFINLRTTAVAGVFGTLPALAPPTTFTANAGPIGYVY